MLNNSLNISHLQKAYESNKALSVQNILEPDYANNLYQAMLGFDWILEINDYNPGGSLKVPLKSIKNHEAPLLNVLDEIEHGLDRHNLFFMRLKVDSKEFDDPVMIEFSDFLNSEDFIAPMRHIVGMDAITHTWSEATCYQSCCFLGGHRDDHHAQNRVAFVLNLTPSWQLDWGGLLMLVEQNMHPVIVPPQWNSLSMFTVPRDHLVSTVSPGARNKRFAITGWLRDGQPPPEE